MTDYAAIRKATIEEKLIILHSLKNYSDLLSGLFLMLEGKPVKTEEEFNQCRFYRDKLLKTGSIYEKIDKSLDHSVVVNDRIKSGRMIPSTSKFSPFHKYIVNERE